jgi:hypothetical protein
VDHYRQLPLFRELELIDEQLRLRVARCVVTVVVKAGLPHADDLGMVQDPLQLAEVEVGCRLVGMQPHHDVDALMLGGDGEGVAPRVRICADRDDPGHARLARTRDRS